MRKNECKLTEESFKKNFGSLYADLRPLSLTAIYYSAIFCLRRLMIAIAVIFLKDEGLFV